MVTHQLKSGSASLPAFLSPSSRFVSQAATTALQRAIDSSSFSLVHLATHGQFSWNSEQTFLLAWDGRINTNALNALFQSRSGGETNPIELLVLSGCESATGDSQALFGLAGVALRARIKSALATSWLISDSATADFMTYFYQELVNGTTLVQALRSAQLSLMSKSSDTTIEPSADRAIVGVRPPRPIDYSHPFYWSPYVLIGDWR